MTQNDLDNGRLVCLIGVAPLRPAEFVIFRIGQWTADAQALAGKETARWPFSATDRTSSSTSSSTSAAGSTDGPQAGFQEVSGIGMEVTVAEYRNGNDEGEQRPQDHRASTSRPT